MIECIFTIDYEIYGNGEGSLRELVYEPSERLRAIFRKWNTRFVVFVEVAELEMIEAERADLGIDLVKRQIREFYEEGFELGLHIHPQWYQGRYENGRWLLDHEEYNLCKLPRERIVLIVDRAIAYFRKVLGDADFTPASFRAGNWLFQPTKDAAAVLADRGIKIDSSVFKGGLQHNHGLDYRPARKNGYYWRFQEDVNKPNSDGRLIELPTYSVMTPSWKMVTLKRIGMGQKSSASSLRGLKKLRRYLDFLRFRCPLKLDFCRMTIGELTDMMDEIVFEDRKDPTGFRPIVAIGHTKDLVDLDTVESFLSYLKEKGIAVTTFGGAYPRCQR
ncbi:MAG: hypothetical protein P0111_07530 [Nitrospira sp.]|nr:hypothetical protein [Nitrospira sp.]